MKTCKLAIIGQGRSGRDIHGAFLRSDKNVHFEVVYVVDRVDFRRERALEEYPGCEVLSDYTELFDKPKVDLVVNASYSDEHYPVTIDLLNHGYNVLVEKPMARNFFEASMMINTAKKNNVTLAVFQQTFLTPFFLETKKIIESGKLGEIKQVSIAYNGFARRWDWQTLQEKMGGSVYNTGPHPLGLAVDLLGYDDITVAYSKLDTVLTSGDANDFAKIILTAPGKPLADVEIHSNDAFNDFRIKLYGSKGTYKCTDGSYQMKYIVDGENDPRPVLYDTLRGEDGTPRYCSEKLVTREESGKFEGSAFDIAVESFYNMLFNTLTTGAELLVKTENIAKLVGVLETIHAQNPLPIKFLGGKHV
ncbi:MAG: Gfo/Idh/MocA family oxidoreductase [Clostridia bacterium]|nr:Gfo/Idh/MocA family oxidoreductase [Clostridia bacterium]